MQEQDHPSSISPVTTTGDGGEAATPIPLSISIRSARPASSSKRKKLRTADKERSPP